MIRSPWRQVARRWSDSRLLTKSLLIVGVPVLALIVTVSISLGLQHQESSYRAVAIADNADLNTSQQTVQLFYQADFSIRGVAASGYPASLTMFDTLVPKLAQRLDTVGAGKVAGTPSTLKAIVTDGRHELAVLEGIRAISVSNGDGGGGSSTAVLIAEDDTTMHRLQGALSILVTEQSSMSKVQRTKIIGAQQLSEWFLIAGLAIGVLGGVLGTVLLSTSVVRRVKLVGVNAERFLVGEPLETFPVSRDEIGQLSDVIVSAGSLLAERNREIASARDDALAANQAKDEFLSRMSHELRTPLTAILGFGQLLQLEPLEAEDRESVDHIVRAGEHLLSLINEVLDIAQVTQGRLDLFFETVDAAVLVAESVALMRPSATERGIVIEIEEGGQELAAVADRQRLHQVLLNLLSNAIKYNRPTGSVIVRTEGDDDCITISVTDTGLGIDESELERVFTPFDRLAAAHSTIEGTGVGLPLSKALAQAMGGALTFRSEIGVGSTFAVRVVRAEEGAAPERRPGGTGSAGSMRGGGTVLYVENDLSNLRVIERVLRHRSELLQVAVQGHMCLTLCRQLRPVLVLLEFHLPDIGGGGGASAPAGRSPDRRHPGGRLRYRHRAGADRLATDGRRRRVPSHAFGHPTSHRASRSRVGGPGAFARHGGVSRATLAARNEMNERDCRKSGH